MLVLDSGNALFKSATPGGTPQEKERAVLLLQQMEALGTAAMAVGARDLTLGTDFLAQTLKGGKLKLLSANLVDARGKRLFPASTVEKVGGVRVGVVGVSPAGPVATARGVKGKPPLPEALAEAHRLRLKEKVDVVVVLAALPAADATTLSLQSGTDVDFILQAHDGLVSMPQRNDFAVVLGSGERGRQVGRLELSVAGSGPFVDLSTTERTRQSLKLLEQNLEQARTALDEAKAARQEKLQTSWQETLTSLERRRADLLRELGTTAEAGKASERTFRFAYTPLGRDVADDPDLKARVERLEPPGSAAH